MGDVLIVGGGVVGLAAARALAAAGAAVTVLDAGRPGGATRAAAGILSPIDPPEWEGALGAFTLAAVDRWPDWAAGLSDEAGVPCGYERRGELRVGPAAEDGGAIVLTAVAGATAAGWRAERLDATGIAALEPAVLADGRCGVHLPDTATVDTGALVAALEAAATLAGATVEHGVTVTRVDLGRREVHAGGRVRRAGRLLLATGAWLPDGVDAGLLRCPVRPLHGERLLVRPHPDHPACRITVREAGGPIVPRADGTAWVGVTVADRGHQAGPTLGAVAQIAGRAIALVPALAHAEVLDVAGGLRPVSEDGLPLLGPVADGVAVALGFGRAGIIQAPPAADVLAAGLARDDWSAVPAGMRAAA